MYVCRSVDAKVMLEKGPLPSVRLAMLLMAFCCVVMYGNFVLL